MYKKLKDKVDFVAVYVREAHPSDGWAMKDKISSVIKQPTSDEERSSVAKTCCTALKVAMPMVVDTIDDRVGNAYSGMPDRLYIIDKWGKVAYKGGRGPMGFKSGEMQQSLLMLLLEENGSRAQVAPSSAPDSDANPTPRKRRDP